MSARPRQRKKTGKVEDDFLLAKMRDKFIETYFPGKPMSIEYHMAHSTKRINYDASLISFNKSSLRRICVPRH